MIGLFREQHALEGSFRFEASPGEEHPIALRLRARRARVLPKLGGSTLLEGEIDAPGFADRRPVEGRVETSAWQPLARRYELELVSNDGRRCRLLAESRPRARDLLWSASNLGGEILDAEGRVLARVGLRIDYRRDLKRLLVG